MSLFKAIKDRLDDRRKMLVEHMATGGCTDWGAYLKCVGQVQAMDETKEEVSDLFKNYNEEAQEDGS